MKRKNSYLTGSISAPLCPVPGKAARLETAREEGVVPCDTEAALLYLKALFPQALVAVGVPPVLMKHQVYSIIHDKTTADREMVRVDGYYKRCTCRSPTSESPTYQLQTRERRPLVYSEIGVILCEILGPRFPFVFFQLMLRDSGRVRLFKLGEAGDDFAVVFSEEYLPHVGSHLGNTPLCRKFVGTALTECRDVSVSKTRLKELHFSEDEISYVTL